MAQAVAGDDAARAAKREAKKAARAAAKAKEAELLGMPQPQ
jgi:cyclin H